MTDRAPADMPELEQEQAPSSSGRKRAGLVLAALIGLLAFAAYRSALFRLESVAITGATRLSEERIMAVADLAPGSARWDHPASAIKERLEREPWIKSATVAWTWGQVTIDVQEREPVGLIRYSDLYYLTLDETGVILEQTDLNTGGLPVVSGKVVTKALRGEQLPDQGLTDALALLAYMAPELRSQVSEVHVDEQRDLTMYMVVGPTVRWGQLPSGPERAAWLRGQIKSFGGEWPKIAAKRSPTCQVDMRVEGRVIQTQDCSS